MCGLFGGVEFNEKVLFYKDNYGRINKLSGPNGGLPGERWKRRVSVFLLCVMAHDVSPVAMFIFIVSMQLLRMSNNLVTVD